MLNANAKWCITGTPMQNNYDELYPLLKFIKEEPFCMPSVWKKFVTDPLNSVKKAFESADDRNKQNKLVLPEEVQVKKVIRRILQPILLRRTKKTRQKFADGTEGPLIVLPEKEVRVETLSLDDESGERIMYERMFQ